MKRTLLLSFFLIIQVGSHAQTPILQWQNCTGGSSEDDGYSVIQTRDSGYITGGFSRSTDGDGDGLGALVVKMCPGGAVQWRRTYTGGLAQVRSVKQTIDGGYIFTGTASAEGGDASGIHGTSNKTDVWVVKLNAYGGIEWQKCLGGSDADGGEDIILTIDGGYIVAAHTESNDGDVSGHHGASSTRLADNWIVKLDHTGNIQWQKCLGGSQREYCSKITQLQMVAIS